jgi:hypothetical protein
MSKMYDYLYNKKPDWFPEKIKPFLGVRGQITRKSLHNLDAYYELPLIGFDEVEKQKAWMRAFAQGLKEHHEFMARSHAKSQIRFIEDLRKKLDSEQSSIWCLYF